MPAIAPFLTGDVARVRDVPDLPPDHPVRAFARHLGRHGRRPDLPGASLPRTAIPKADLDEAGVRALGFVPTLVAVPERGQARLTSFRHPDALAHLHDHGDRWLLHQDRYPSAQMAAARRLRAEPDAGPVRRAAIRAAALAEAAPHVALEGVPGFARYLAGAATAAPTFAEQLDPAAHEAAKRRQRRRVLLLAAAALGAGGAALAYRYGGTQP